MKPISLLQLFGPRGTASVILLVIAGAVVYCSINPDREQEKPAEAMQSDRFGIAESVFSIDAKEIDESSGLIPSVQYQGCFWTHNDNGKHPGLFLFGPDGKHLATVQIRKIDDRDWESIANVRRGDRNLIAIGNIGDNSAEHKTCQIFLIEEPDMEIDLKANSPEKLSIRLDQTITFRYPDGPQDCEAMAYDAAGDRFWFISKQRPGGPGKKIAGGKNSVLASTVIHFLDWPAAGQESNQTTTATRIDTVFNALFVTDMDISADDRVAVVRTPLQAFLFDRIDKQSWRDVFSKSPSAITIVPFQLQGESICFSLDRKSLWLTSEGVGQPVWKIPLLDPADRK